MAPHVFSAVSALLVAAASLCSVGEADALPSAWTNLPKPPAKFSHQHSKCGWLDVCEECVHKDGAWKKVHAPSGTYCDDGYYCNGRETCDANGRCKRGHAVDCEKDEKLHWGDIHPSCGKAVCSERHKSCKVAIKPGSCKDGDKCTTQDQCDLVTGQCVGIPKWCGSECHECDSATGNCGRGCGPKKDCKWGTCVEEEKQEKTCTGQKVCNAKGCKWIGCGECEECKWGKCVPVECGWGKECVAHPVTGEHECKKPEVDGCKHDKDCFKKCQVCDQTAAAGAGECTDDLSKESCECPHHLKKKMCGDCDVCNVTEIDADKGKILACEPGCPAEDEPVCTDIVEVVCYKCGKQPLYCLALGDDTLPLPAIGQAIEDTCEAKGKSGKMVTCAQQTCGNDIIVALAPTLMVNTVANQRRIQAGGPRIPGPQCLPAPGEKFECPCDKDGKAQHIDNVAKYKVCISDGPASGSASLTSAPPTKIVQVLDTGCEKVCDKKKGKVTCHADLCPEEMLGMSDPTCVEDGLQDCKLEADVCEPDMND